jgi:GMP synthase-like glutamine amidotransferase
VPVLVFRHVPFEHLGWIADALGEHGLGWRYVDLHELPDADIALADVDALIFMGGPMSANDDLPYIRRELAVIVEAVALGKPVLGVCLGAQLIAKALCGSVHRNAVKEIGWLPVTWTVAANTDRLFAGLANPETVFHWHGETFDLPPRAELLASSAGCRHQAYRIGDRIYGLQFHLEVTPQMIGQWCAEDANCGDMREVAEPIDPYAHSARIHDLAGLIFGRWCKLIIEFGRRCAA